MQQSVIANRLFESEKVYSIVLCGGSGTRLWPLSRKAMPKQFLSLGGRDESLLQLSLDRVKHISPRERRWLVLGGAQEELARKQVESDVSRLLLEPQARNTAPAVAWAAWELMKSDPDSLMLICSSDHVIQNIRSFEQTVFDAVQLAKSDRFVTIGIRPTFPSTGFGYIECGSSLDHHGLPIPSDRNSESGDFAGFDVRSFREKPNQSAAEQFIRTGKYLWNAGIFVWKTRTFWQAFSQLQPEMARLLETSDASCFAEHYGRMESIPIDIAFMEQTNGVACVPALFDWSDIGSWAAVRNCFEQDNHGNNLSGDVFVADVRGSLVHSSGPFIATIGVENLAVIATPDAVLVMPLERSQEVKQVVNHLESSNRKELL